MVEIIVSHEAEVGGLPVRRALPRRPHRTVGAFCFLDHFGPVDLEQSAAMQVGPHPHIGLQTVTWLLEGDVLHTDSVGSEQPIRPGQVNLMTAGRGVAHAESARRSDRGTHGIQLWVAQPESTRHGDPAFEHHAELPSVDLGAGTASVIVGELGGIASPARHDTPLVAADLAVRPGTSTVPLDPTWEHAVVVSEGVVEVDGARVVPGQLAYLGLDRHAVELRSVDAGRALLVGGEPFEDIVMWWNFVARTREEMVQARQDWEAASDRFGPVETELGRIAAPPPLWDRPGMKPPPN